MKLYWTAFVKAQDRRRLQEAGFRLIAQLPDYAFLEARVDNQDKIMKETDLGVVFLRSRGVLEKVGQDELDRMDAEVSVLSKEGTKVKATTGIFEGMEGTVLKSNEEGDQILVEFKGRKRAYSEWMKKDEVVLSKEVDEKTPSF